MPNLYGIPESIERRLRRRDAKCIYCQEKMTPFSSKKKSRSNMATIEHFREEGPIFWRDGLKEADLGICCWSCNSSRGEKDLLTWFETNYCINRNISRQTVSKPVQRYLSRLHKEKQKNTDL